MLTHTSVNDETGLQETQETLEDDRTSTVLGLAGDAELLVAITGGGVEVGVAVITDDVALTEWEMR